MRFESQALCSELPQSHQDARVLSPLAADWSQRWSPVPGSSCQGLPPVAIFQQLKEALFAVTVLSVRSLCLSSINCKNDSAILFLEIYHLSIYLKSTEHLPRARHFLKHLEY